MINDNGAGIGGGLSQVGIALEDGSVASIISGVTAGDTHPSRSKTQLYALETVNTAVAYAFDNKFEGNATGPVYVQPSSTVENLVNEGSCTVTSSTYCTVTFNTPFNITPTNCSANSGSITLGAVALTSLSTTQVTFTVPTSGNYTIYYRCAGY
jgi:hypothetical protein